MKCPYCGTDQLRVVDTTHDSEDSIRRRRECKACGQRFSTFEKIVRATPMLIKGNGDREAFDRNKLIRGIQISCAKRPIPAAAITDLVDRIELHLQSTGKIEVSSRVVGDMVIDGLKEIDPIAYVRYAIVYLGLDSLGSVQEVLEGLLAESGPKKRVKKAAKKPVQAGSAPANHPDQVQPALQADVGGASPALTPEVPVTQADPEAKPDPSST
ncbi:MAG: transcriptional repressor NrdR [Chloroflexi bacterium]|nr:transcriptional repressor NrdR [Chloroflexota bacterium]